MASQCPICSSPDVSDYQFKGEKKKYAFNGKTFTYKTCGACGLIFADPLPDEDDVNTFYSSHFAYDQYERLKPFKRRQARNRAEDLSDYFRLNGLRRVLDVGAGHGFFVEAVAGQGIEAVGFDISASPSLSQLAGGKLYYLPSLAGLDETGFDLVTMWHTLEHIPQPYPFIAEVARRIRPGGKLLIAVPNSRSLGLETSGYLWNWLQDPYVHPLHYNGDNLRLLLEKSGLKVVDTRTRDTWDSNLGDSLALFRKPKNVLVNLMPESWAFYIHQGYRLAFTAVSRAVKGFRNADTGAELIVVAQKAEA